MKKYEHYYQVLVPGTEKVKGVIDPVIISPETMASRSWSGTRPDSSSSGVRTDLGRRL